MGKRGRTILFILLILISLNFVIAQTSDAEDSTNSVDQAYLCLEDQIGDSCGNLNDLEQIFSVLALGDYQDCINTLLENARDDECWPGSGCRLKETALASLALDRSGELTEVQESWLLNQTKSVSELTWLLQIESESESTCTISTGSGSNSITINKDKTLSSGAGSCLPLYSNGYWLQIDSRCLDNEFTISCDQDFSTTLLYKTQDSSTIHVSPNINSAAANGQTTKEVTYKCFEQGTVCDYEGSLWAAMTLDALGHDVSDYLPYLIAFKDSNQQYFPEAFLYQIIASDEYLTPLLQDNFRNNLWQVGTYNRYYSTALAFLSLRGQTPLEVETAKDYLLTEAQDDTGCWNNNNLRDTAFLLYSGWPRNIQSPSQPPPADSEDCELSGNYCLSRSECNAAAGVSLDFEGCTSLQVCCSESLLTCSAQGGTICDTGEKCDGQIASSSDFGTCCLDSCVIDDTPRTGDDELTCGVQGNEGTCKSFCGDNEQEDVFLTCSAGQVCCVEEDSPNTIWWIVLLLILIILVVLAIIFRKKLKLLFFKFKSKFRKGPAPNQTRPPGYPPHQGGPGRPMPPRQFTPPPGLMPPTRRPLPPRNSPQDKQFDETLKKLRDMRK